MTGAGQETLFLDATDKATARVSVQY
jgi:hypothetical protein